MKISVIIPTHNRAHTLPRAIDSVLAQTHPAMEIVVVDDGGSDESCSLIAEKYPQIILHQQPHMGVSAARNRGIRESTGDWLAFLDSDDEWLPQKLEKQCAALVAEPQYRICHSDEIWIRHGSRVNPMLKHAKSGGFIFRQCLPRCVISPSAAMLHRSVFDKVGLFDENLSACEDYDLWLRVCSRYPVLFVADPLIRKYGGHDDQLSQYYWGMDRFRITALEKILTAERLAPDDRDAALETIIEKLGIVHNGTMKRQKHAKALEYESKLQKFEDLLLQLRRQSRHRKRTGGEASKVKL